ncbi:hypothetical protein C7I85_29410 [Mesorhizobium soli]|uniref:Uncharacterized protein n=1 Tax=Pseudaminobacter soli (ex Li et al. 2025) TaxID=1295366 RepID=A0A2P7RMH9_9HYPH|nr:hypothetical protein C7I85_29410 [Mesorhizobium soli]
MRIQAEPKEAAATDSAATHAAAVRRPPWSQRILAQTGLEGEHNVVRFQDEARQISMSEIRRIAAIRNGGKRRSP